MRKMLIVAGFLVVATARCAGPCEELANAICNCEDDATAALSCRNQVGADAGSVKVTKQQADYCAQKLKICSCSRLARGDRAACGLTRE